MPCAGSLDGSALPIRLLVRALDAGRTERQLAEIAMSPAAPVCPLVIAYVGVLRPGINIFPGSLPTVTERATPRAVGKARGRNGNGLPRRATLP
jgi:hypothetical protein